MPYQFGDFTCDPEQAELRYRTQVIPVQPQVLDLLALFVRNPNVLFTREHLSQHLWPSVHVSDDALYQTLRKVRRCLKAHDDQQWIQTVHGRGYRFVGQVHAPPEPQTAAAEDDFIGRRAELDHLTELFAGEQRAVCISGAGGAGKTRLAMAYAKQQPRPVVWVDLSDESKTSGLFPAVAHALGVELSGKSDPPEHIGHALAGRDPVLLLLDNAETVGPDVAKAVQGWVQRVESLHCVMTSRERTARPLIADFPIPPLTTPDATALFRRRVHDRDITLDAEWEPDVERIVTHLEGHPLGIELAAARIGLLDPRALAERVSTTLSVLGQRRGGLQRHRSLDAAMQGSWDLLNADERRVLTALAVFPASFSVDQADALTGESTLTALEALRDHSLIVALPEHPGRLRLLHPVREFVRHAAASLPVDRLVDTMHALACAGPATWLDTPSLIAAARHATTPDVAVAVGCAAARTLIDHGRHRQAAELLDELPMHDASRLLQCRWWLERASTDDGTRAVDAYVQPLRDHADVASANGQPDLSCDLLCTASLLLHREGQQQAAMSLGEQAVAQAEEAVDLERLVVACQRTAAPALFCGEFERAWQAVELGLASLRPEHAARAHAGLLDTRGALLTREGRMDEAIESARLAVKHIETTDSVVNAITFRMNLANSLQEAGRFTEAIPAQSAVIDASKHIGQRMRVCQGLISRALTWMHLGDYARAEADLIEAARDDVPSGTRIINWLNRTANYTLQQRYELAVEQCQHVLDQVGGAKVIEGAVLIWGLWSAHATHHAQREAWTDRTRTLLDEGLPPLVADSLRVVLGAMSGQLIETQPDQHPLVHLTARAVRMPLPSK